MSAVSPRDRIRSDMLSDGTMSVKQAAQFTGFGTRMIYDALVAGSLSYVQCGKRKVIPRKALLEFLNDRLVLR